MEQDKAAHEVARVLYVAATRAREQLHLVATLDADEAAGTPRPPPARSLLSLLWGGIGVDEAKPRAPAAIPASPPGDRPLARAGRSAPRRLPGGWTAPAPPAAVAPLDAAPLPADEDRTEGIEFDWAGQLARHVGTVACDRHASARA